MQTDVLILGCGIAGTAAALELAADRERRILVVTRASDAEESNSSYAQGGIVGRGIDDDAQRLTRDILDAGSGLCRKDAVRLLAEEGPETLRRILVETAGIAFDRDESGALRFGLEAAHSRRRILHVGDMTGRAVMRGLLDALAGCPNVELLTEYTAVDLLCFPHHAPDPLAVYDEPRCVGAYALDRRTGKVEAIRARHTLLATGGLGQIYLNTTNPSGARGDGLAMAYRAGARVANCEYVQFHPTALHMAGTTKMLISEAVRGEGAVLRLPDGRSFLERYAPVERELATRDVVARAIYTEMLANDEPYVLLDIASRKPAEFIRRRFPGIRALCLEHHLDIAREPIPVVPAAHYFCGGVLVDLWGRTTLDGLYAIGEVACSGVHGANRLASTSLLEGLVWADRAARDIRSRGADDRAGSAREVPDWDESELSYEADPALIQADLQNIRNLMWHYVGLIRTADRLQRAQRDLRRLWSSIEDFYRRAYLTDPLIGLRNMALNSVILSAAALRNRTSRGSHYRE